MTDFFVDDSAVLDGDFRVIMTGPAIAEHNALMALYKSLEGVIANEFISAAGDRLHAVLGASSAERWMNCSASVHLSKKAPRRPTSSFAQEGTAAHELAEMTLRMDVHPSFFEGQVITTRGEILEELPDEIDPENLAFEIEADMIDAVALYHTTINEQYEFLRSVYGVDPIRFLEKSFNLSRLYPGMFGTNDYGLFVVGEMLIVIDYKHGRGKVVEVSRNAQLLYYALGAILEICKKTRHFPKTIRIMIVQPRAAHRDGPVRYEDYTLAEVQEFAKELVRKAKETERTDTKPVAGPWCQFCNANGATCHAVAEEARELVMTDDTFGDLTDEERGLPSLTVQEAVERTVALPGGLSRALTLAPMLDAYVRGVEAFAQHELENGRSIRDASGNKTHKLVRKRSNRRLKREVMMEGEARLTADLIQEKIADGTITEGEAYTRKLKSPAQLEKTKLGKTFVAGLTEKPPGGLTLALIDDNRDEVEMNPFEDLTDEDMMIPGQVMLPAPDAGSEWDIA